MKDSLVKHIAIHIFNCNNRPLPFPLLAKLTLVCLGLSRFVMPMLCGSLIRGRVVEREEENEEEEDDETRHGEVQLTFSGCTAYPYQVCHCFIILSAFL